MVQGRPPRVQGSPPMVQGSPPKVPGRPPVVQGRPPEIEGSPPEVEGRPPKFIGLLFNKFPFFNHLDIRTEPKRLLFSSCKVQINHKKKQKSPDSDILKQGFL